MTRPLTVIEHLDKVDYAALDKHKPSQFAIRFINLINLIHGDRGTENPTPPMHYAMLDELGKEGDVINLCYRGSAKSALFGQYLPVYLAIVGELPGMGRVPCSIYMSDSAENGVKKMRERIETMLENSDFLKEYISDYQFNETMLKFWNKDGVKYVTSMHGAQTRFRGVEINGMRPVVGVLDDLIKDSDARSPTVLKAVSATVNAALEYGMHPTNRKIIWSGTPFNAGDPLYKAIESGAWRVNVYPMCDKFPVEEKDYRGAWETRIPYKAAKRLYTKALLGGTLQAFNQELMLRIMTDDTRVIQDHDIQWYSQADLMKHKDQYHFYITTDYATSESDTSCLSYTSVWAVNSAKMVFWVDGECKHQLMDKNVDTLFRFCEIYNPKSVGVEVSGQQKGFISWISREMIQRNMPIPLASDKNTNEMGIRPKTGKYERFSLLVPWFKQKKMYFPEEMRQSPEMLEAMDELQLVSLDGFKSKNKDFLDTASMLLDMPLWFPRGYDVMGDTKASASPDAWGEISDYLQEDSSPMDSYTGEI